MAQRRDYAELALIQARPDFVRMCGAHPFLVGRAHLRRPTRPQLTGMIKAFDNTLDEGMGGVPEADTPLVLPILKLQPNFPSMITIGRTENNDIPLPDVTISRFHAFFRQAAAGLELADAGSRNGTWLGGKKLVAKAPAVSVPLGEVVRFGSLSFVVVDAGGCWDELHKLG
jgi:pSer/pThr/pTyr-binding forkhead associated (FHA) protein